MTSWISSVGRAVVSYTTDHQFDSDIQLHRQLARQDVNKAGIWHSSSMAEPSASEGYMQTKHLRCWFKSNLCHKSLSVGSEALAITLVMLTMKQDFVSWRFRLSGSKNRNVGHYDSVAPVVEWLV